VWSTSVSAAAFGAADPWSPKIGGASRTGHLLDFFDPDQVRARNSRYQVSMSTTEQTTDQALSPSDEPGDQFGAEQILSLEVSLSEAEALRAWLLRPAADGATALEDPLVSRVLSSLSRAVDAVLATVNVRRELEQAGLVVDHLTDEQVRELGRRVSEAALPAVRA
jgi:hypothetical protein